MAPKKKNIQKKVTPLRRKAALPKTVKVHYLKTSSYRTYYVDGVFGGLTPNGKIYMELFLQRLVTPQTIEYKVEEAGLGKEIGRIGKEGLIREIEAGLIMDIESAKVFRNWIDDKVKQIEQQLSKKRS